MIWGAASVFVGWLRYLCLGMLVLSAWVFVRVYQASYSRAGLCVTISFSVFIVLHFEESECDDVVVAPFRAGPVVC